MLSDIFPKAARNPGATRHAIVVAEASLGVPIPEELQAIYLECDGFREDKGNAEYLFRLLDGDSSLVRITRFLWSEFEKPDLRPFVFFGSSSADEYWGVNWQGGGQIVAYHHHMMDEFETVGASIVAVWLKDYARYDTV